MHLIKALLLSSLLIFLALICPGVHYFDTAQPEQAPSQMLLVSYIDHLSSYYGAESVAAAIGVPGYANDTSYNVIILAFLENYGAADAVSVWT